MVPRDGTISVSPRFWVAAQGAVRARARHGPACTRACCRGGAHSARRWLASRLIVCAAVVVFVVVVVVVDDVAFCWCCCFRCCCCLCCYLERFEGEATSAIINQ